MLHALKTHPEYFKAVKSGEKTFELRKADRPFKLSDTLVLQEWNPQEEVYTGEEQTFTISYILSDAEKFGLKKGHVILGLKPKE